MTPDLRDTFGPIDIYLFDQLLRGRLKPPMRVLDAGCGEGRNLVYLMRSGFEVYGTDANTESVAAVQSMARRLAPRLHAANFRVEPVETMSFADGSMDVVLSSAVVHFARDDEHFLAMLREMWRILATGGLFFCRLASDIGMEGRMRPLEGRRHLLLDGSERYLVDEPMLRRLTGEMGGEQLDPLKTTVVQNQRCMTTWILRKSS